MANQEPLIIRGGSITKNYGDDSFTLVVMGGTGDGSVSYEIVTGANIVVDIDKKTEEVIIIGVGEATVIAKKAGDDSYRPVSSEPITIIVERRDLSEVEISVNGNITYTGSEQKPIPFISDSSLIANSDYTVSYSNNKNAGIATITIAATDKGNYIGSRDINFTINKRNLSVVTANVNIAFEYNGDLHTPTPYIDEGDSISASDYTLSYRNNKDAGIATVTITATADGNYIGFKSIDYSIGKRNLSNATVSVSGTFTYNGNAHNPNPTVSDGAIPITTFDYTVSHSNNTNAGTAILTITATANGNYTGTCITSFTINKAVGGAVNGTIAMESFGYQTLTVAPLTTTTGQSVEYALVRDDGSWHRDWNTSRTFTGLENNGYYVYSRSVSSTNYDTGNTRSIWLSGENVSTQMTLVVSEATRATVRGDGLKLYFSAPGHTNTWGWTIVESGSISVGTYSKSLSFRYDGGYVNPWAIEEIGLRWFTIPNNMGQGRSFKFSSFTFAGRHWLQFSDGSNGLSSNNILTNQVREKKFLW